MQPSEFMVEKLNFFELYDSKFNDEQTYDVGLREEVAVRIACPKMDKLDKKLMMIILNDSRKKLGSDTVSCFIKKSDLMKRLGILDGVLLERIRKLKRIQLELFSKERDSDSNFCELRYSTENGMAVEYEVMFNNLAVLKKHFSQDFIELLLGNVDTGPTGAHKIVVDGQELIFISYQQASDYGEREIQPIKTNYSIYHVLSRQLVFAWEKL